MDQAIQILSIVCGVVLTLSCVGAIPFAISVTGRLAAIENELKRSVDFENRLRSLELRFAEERRRFE